MLKHKQTDPYVYPESSVLINAFDLRDKDKLQELEGSIFALQDLKPLPSGFFDYSHLKAIHHHYFSSIYEWAGKERTVNISKDQTYFADHRFISTALHKLFAELKNETHLSTLPQNIFCQRLAYYFNEINAAHPFREGNGRTQRAFCNVLSENAGYQLDWTRVDKADYLNASIQGFQGDNQPMETLLLNITTPLQQVEDLKIDRALIQLVKDFAEKQVELIHYVTQKTHYLATDETQAKNYAQKALILNQTLQEISKELIQHPEVKEMLKPPSSITLQEQGGFIQINQRAQQNLLKTADILAIAKYARASVIALSQSRTHSLSY